MEENNNPEEQGLSSYWQRRKYKKEEEHKKAKSWLREWVDAIVFAFIAAAILRAFLFGSYKIPTPSMEKTLMTGDLLIVSNVTYGPRTPMALCVPFLQGWCVPGVKLPWTRLPGFRDIERNDIFVFNVPWEVKPVSQKTNYIKRAVAVAGDTISIQDKILFINGEREEQHEGVQRHYVVRMANRVRLSNAKMESVGGELMGYTNNDNYIVNMSEEVAEVVGSWAEVDTMYLNVSPPENTDRNYIQSEGDFSRAFSNADQMPSIVVPFEGQTIELNNENWFIYKDIIERYERNDLRREGGTITINGEETNRYTIKQNYYFAMGDNRDNSQDSRFWGFVPQDHVIGKAAIVWFSTDNWVPRFNRVFTLID
ncbi:MAG: signal peptidase I [Gracilimonas sp.]